MDNASPQPPSPTSSLSSLIGKSGRVNITAIGLPRRWLTDAYARLMEMRWYQLILLFAVGFLGFNIVFAFLYWLQPGSLATSEGVSAGTTILDAFFFSVQTVATIGYGAIYPKTLYANWLVTFEIMAGVIGFAMGNGLMFARFSRPTARIMFSKMAVIVAHNGVPTLMFRAANQRHNLILEAHVRVAVTRTETSTEGITMRRFRDLPVERSDNLTFILSWTVMHPVGPSSPLYGMTPEDLAASDLAIVVIMTGTDQSFAQQVHARHTYNASDIIWNRNFSDILGVGDDGKLTIDYGKFHQVVEPVA